jgi:predicted RNA-binding Zn ribbon-like protein
MVTKLKSVDAGETGGRQRADGDLGVVQAFLNTHDLEEGVDRVASPELLGRFLRQKGWLQSRARISYQQHRRALGLREALRGLLEANSGRAVPPAAWTVLRVEARRASLVSALSPGGGRPASFETALERLLTAVAQAQADGRWQRLKTCASDACRWAFYDRSRNRSSRWCEMGVCGSRVKMRAYRRRRSTARSK